MQPEKSTKLDFLRRTDALAAKLGYNLEELPAVLGFSRASLFAYRAGSAKITRKAWSRLALAETDAGIKTPLVERLTADDSKDGWESLLKATLSEHWDDNDEAQFEALLGTELVGQAVLNSWGIIEAPLRVFLRKVRRLENLPGDLEQEIPHLQDQLRAFRFQLSHFVHIAAHPKTDPPPSDVTGN